MFSANNIYRVEIATVGLEDASVFKKTFNGVGFIKLSSPIKLEVTNVPFNKKSYKEFLNAKLSQSSHLDIEYIDSLKSKPKYLSVKVTDALNLINQLHESSNEGVRSYLETNQQAGIVTNLSLAYPKTLLEEFQDAEAVFLVQTADAIYQFQLILKNGGTKHISFKEGVTMDYEISKACWKQARQNTYRIVDLIASGNKCASGTYRTPKSIKTEEDYFKF